MHPTSADRRARQRDILSFALVYLVPFSVLAGYWLGGAYTFLTPVFVFGVVPVLDLLIGRDVRNPVEDEMERLENIRAYRFLTWGCAPVQLAIVLWGAHVVAGGNGSLTELAGLTVSIGISSGILGINVAHELVHRVNHRYESLLGKLMLTTVFYSHWGQEHIVGHHRWVATPEDPATARLGESYYTFWPRTVSGGFRKAWRFAAVRREKQGRPVWSPGNPVVALLAVQAVLLVFVGFFWGALAAVYLIVQGIIAFSLLEIVNYIEHYGLRRQQTETGRYEPVKPVHSWNSSNWLTNRFLFNLQRHSDHHFKPGRRYPLLHHHEESPQLPTGYAGMVVLAAIPPLWRYVMDHRARRFRETAS